MVIAKKKAKTAKLKLNKLSIVVISIVGVVVLVIGGLWLRSYLIEKQAINELVSAGDKLKAVYNNLLTQTEGNTAHIFFRYDCSMSNVNWLEQKISCGPSGNITVKEALIDFDNVAQNLTQLTKGSGFDINPVDVEVGQDSVSIAVEFSKDIRCHISYSQNTLNHEWSYSLVCRKNVDRVLPGYVVEE